MKCERLFYEIDSMEDEYLRILEDVCNIESPTADKAGVDAVGEYFARMANKRAWRVEIDRQEISGNVVTITLNPDANEPPVVLSAHMDTVHPVGSFGTPAVKRDEKKMYGPGVMDCKGGAVAAFMAMVALEKCGFSRRPVTLILQSDEENGSASSGKATVRYMCERSKGAVAFLNLEGMSGNSAVVSRKGILRYRFDIRGIALHSARCPEAASAIAEAAHKILRLEELKDPVGLTCNCGIISGGTVANTVPEHCSFIADIRYSTEDERKKVETLVCELASKSFIKGCECELKLISSRPAMPRISRNEELLKTMNEIYEQNGLPILKPRDCLSGSDAAYISEAGIPCIDCIGTEGSNIHSLDEFIYLCSLCESAKRIASVIYLI